MYLARHPDECVWSYLTDPLHDKGDRARAAPTVVAIKPDSMPAVRAMVAARLARPAGWVNTAEEEMYELVGVFVCLRKC